MLSARISPYRCPLAFLAVPPARGNVRVNLAHASTNHGENYQDTKIEPGHLLLIICHGGGHSNLYGLKSLRSIWAWYRQRRDNCTWVAELYNSRGPRRRQYGVIRPLRDGPRQRGL